MYLDESVCLAPKQVQTVHFSAAAFHPFLIWCFFPSPAARALPAQEQVTDYISPSRQIEGRKTASGFLVKLRLNSVEKQRKWRKRTLHSFLIYLCVWTLPYWKGQNELFTFLQPVCVLVERGLSPNPAHKTTRKCNELDSTFVFGAAVCPGSARLQPAAIFCLSCCTNVNWFNFPPPLYQRMYQNACLHVIFKPQNF